MEISGLPYGIPQQSNSSMGLGEKYGVAMLADGVPQVLMRVREQLRFTARRGWHERGP